MKRWSDYAIALLIALLFLVFCAWLAVLAGQDTVARQKQFDDCTRGSAAGCQQAIDDQYRQSITASQQGDKEAAAERMKALQANYKAATGRTVLPDPKRIRWLKRSAAAHFEETKTDEQ